MQPGTYDVSLTVTNDAGSNTITKSNYVSISANAEMTGPIFKTLKLKDSQYMKIPLVQIG